MVGMHVREAHTGDGDGVYIMIQQMGDNAVTGINQQPVGYRTEGGVTVVPKASHITAYEN